MSLAKILAPLTGTPRDEIVLATAFAAAKPFNAHVAALFIHPDPRLAVPFVGVPVSPDVVQDIVNASEEIAKTAESRVRESLKAAAAKAGAVMVEHPKKADAVTCSLGGAQGAYFRAVAQAAELSDVVAFGVIAGPDSVELSEGFIEVLTRSGRPILLSAEAPADIARRVVLGWDGGASAARAASAALPFLKKAENIVVLSIKRPGQHNGTDFAGLCEFLGLHGLSVTEQTVEQNSRPIGEALLHGAALAGADLLVMGAYARGSLRESVFGGVTSHIRSHATLPIFMAH
jgi:nucleotide-binding universal stress UspA family protein